MQKSFLELNSLNSELKKNAKKVILTAENQYKKQLEEASRFILKRKDTKVILIAGPSCAGKTTTAELLGDILEARGKQILNVAIDNFFIDRSKRRVLPDGSIDFDSIDVVDLELMSKCFKRLFKNGKAMFPEYDFEKGLNKKNKIPYEVTDDTILVIEGTHAFNPKFISHLETENVIKIYVANYTGYEFEGKKIETRQFRLARRLIRDVVRRKTPPQDTFEQWDNVCSAEKKYIVPYINTADIVINTSHSYEIGLYKSAVAEMISAGEIDTREYPWFNIFSNATEVDKNLLPKETTLMKEFIDL